MIPKISYEAADNDILGQKIQYITAKYSYYKMYILTSSLILLGIFTKKVIIVEWGYYILYNYFIYKNW